MAFSYQQHFPLSVEAAPPPQKKKKKILTEKFSQLFTSAPVTPNQSYQQG